MNYLNIFILICYSSYLMAVPFKPQDNKVIFELSAYRSLSDIQKLQQQLNQDPNNLVLALQLAKKYIKLSELNGASRYQGYAQAVLMPWWDLPKAPISVLLMRANLHQKQHQFQLALADLKKILSQQKNYSQARLKRAFIYRTLGQYDLGLKDCRQLNRHVSSTIMAICYNSMLSLKGQAQSAYKNLQAFANIQDQTTRQWILTELAEMSVRLGFNQKALNYFKQALKIKSHDLYLENAFADFLLSQNQAQKVLNLFQKRAGNIPTLRLRIAIALKKLKRDFSQDQAYLSAYFALEKARQSELHLLDKARFLLIIKEDKKQALILAKKNWQIQKEPLDALIYLQALIANHQPAPEIKQWQSLEDIRIQFLLAKLK